MGVVLTQGWAGQEQLCELSELCSTTFRVDGVGGLCARGVASGLACLSPFGLRGITAATGPNEQRILKWEITEFEAPFGRLA